MSHGIRTEWYVEVAGEAPYTIAIGPGLLDDGDDACSARTSARPPCVDRQRQPRRAAVRRTGRSRRCARRGRHWRSARFVMPAGEQEKTLARFGECLDALAALGATRDATVVALGGGVVGDLAGFAAACWMRGIDCVQLPTTLLAMVDSSVGGKTAVDLPAGQEPGRRVPSAARGDRRHHACCAPCPTANCAPAWPRWSSTARSSTRGFLGWLDAHADALLARDDAALAEAIARSCEFKADVVARDPFEHGDRAMLNFGHTFGHAIEAEQGYAGTGGDALNHGEAVAVGMVLAARLSAALGRAPPADARPAAGAAGSASACRPRSRPGWTPRALLDAHAAGQEGRRRRPALHPLGRHAGAARVVAGECPRRRCWTCCARAERPRECMSGQRRSALTMRAPCACSCNNAPTAAKPRASCN